MICSCLFSRRAAIGHPRVSIHTSILLISFRRIWPGLTAFKRDWFESMFSRPIRRLKG